MASRFFQPIKEMMEEHPILRENPNFLISYIWERQCLELGITTSNGLLSAIVNKLVWNPETIRRTRRKVIEAHPELSPSRATQDLHAMYEALIRSNGGSWD